MLLWCQRSLMDGLALKRNAINFTKNIYINIKFMVSRVFSSSLSSRFARTLYRTLCVGSYAHTQTMCWLLSIHTNNVTPSTVAGWGFPWQGYQPPRWGGGCQPIIWPNFSQNCMTMKEIGPKRGSNLGDLLHLVTRAKHGYLLVWYDKKRDRIRKTYRGIWKLSPFWIINDELRKRYF